MCSQTKNYTLGLNWTHVFICSDCEFLCAVYGIPGANGIFDYFNQLLLFWKIIKKNNEGIPFYHAMKTE